MQLLSMRYYKGLVYLFELYKIFIIYIKCPIDNVNLNNNRNIPINIPEDS